MTFELSVFATEQVGTDFWESFWPGFWGNLLADFIVGIILVWLIQEIIKRRTRAELSAVASLRFLADGSAELMFYVSNNGRRSFREKEIYWSLYVDTQIIPSGPPASVPGVLSTLRVAEQVHIGSDIRLSQWNGLLDAPVFVNTVAGLCYIRVERSRPGSEELFRLIDEVERQRTTVVMPGILYSFSTAHGFFPKGFHWRKGPKSYGRVKLARTTNFWEVMPQGEGRV